MRICIVGLGRIGATQPDVSGVARSHLSAALHCKDVSVTALVDVDPVKRTSAALLAPGAHCYADVSEIRAGSVDVIVDARPAHDRAGLAQVAVQKQAKILILEKPLAFSLEQAHRVAEVTRGTSMAVRVMFHRRFDKGHLQAFQLMREPPLTAWSIYSKGLLNYGSHLVDLLLDRFGPVCEVQSAGPDDGSEDPTIGFDLTFEDGRRAFIRAAPAANFDVFEVVFFGKNSRLDFMNGGATRRLALAANDQIYPGYVHLGCVLDETAPVGGFLELYVAMKEHLIDKKMLPGTTVQEAINGMAVLEAVRRSARFGGQPIRLQPVH